MTFGTTLVLPGFLFLSFFLSFSNIFCLPSHCRCWGLFMYLDLPLPLSPSPLLSLSLSLFLGRTTLGKESAGRRELYLTTHSTHKRHASMSTAGLEPAAAVTELLQTYPHAPGSVVTSRCSDFSLERSRNVRKRLLSLTALPSPVIRTENVPLLNISSFCTMQTIITVWFI